MIINIKETPCDISEDDMILAKDFAIMEYPKEMCGVFTKSRGFVKLTNIADNPEEDFVIREASRIFANIDDVIAIVHSHCNASALPSEEDMVSQIATGVTWCILSVTNDEVNSVFWTVLEDDNA